MVSMDAFASAFGLASKQGETWFTLGKVTGVNGSKLSVLMGGSATPTECEAYCLAGVGDVVLIIIKDGAPRAIATHGGVNDASKWRDALGLGSMALEDSSDYLPVSGGTLTGSLTVDTDSVTISDAGDWRAALGVDVWGQVLEQTGNLSLSTSAQKVPLKTFTGNGCSLSANGIKVSKAGHYMVAGSIYMTTGYTANDLIHAAVYVNSTNVGDCLTRPPIANPYQTATITPFVVSLAANDVVYLYAYNQTAARGVVSTRDAVGLTIWKID